MISRAGKIGEEGRWAHTARHTSEMSAIVDPSYVTSRSAKVLRRKSRRAIVRSDLGVVRKRESGAPERGVMQTQVVSILSLMQLALPHQHTC